MAWQGREQLCFARGHTERGRSRLATKRDRLTAQFLDGKTLPFLYLFFTEFAFFMVKQPRLENCTKFERSFCKLLSDKDRVEQNAVVGAKMVQKRCSFLAW